MTVGWDRSPVVAGWAGLAPLDAGTTADLCVVGLGGSGLAAVRWAVDRGLDVVGIDAGRVAGAAAGRNGGFLLGGLARFHHQAVDALGSAVAVEWYRATLAELADIAGRHGDVVVRRTGSVRLASDDAEWDDCRAHARALGEAGISAELRDTPFGRGLVLPNDAACNPAELWLREARSLAGRARLHERTAAVTVRPGAVETPGGTISAAAVVVCVDGRLDAVVPSLAGRIRTARLQMLATERVPDVAWLDRPVYARWGYDWAQQAPDGRIYAGGGRDLHADVEWTDADEPTAPVQAHIEAFAGRLAGRSVTVAERWAALVAFTEDGMPVCELVDDGVAAAGGYDGTGNLVGRICARRAAELAVSGAS